MERQSGCQTSRGVRAGVFSTFTRIGSRTSDRIQETQVLRNPLRFIGNSYRAANTSHHSCIAVRPFPGCHVSITCLGDCQESPTEIMILSMRRSQIQSTAKRASAGGQTGHPSTDRDARDRRWHRPTMRRLPVGLTATGFTGGNDGSFSMYS